MDLTSFFEDRQEGGGRLVFTPADAVEVKFPNMPDGAVQARLLYPVDFEVKAEPYLIEITPKATLPAHFFFHKGEEIGYLLSGRLQVQGGQRGLQPEGRGRHLPDLGNPGRMAQPGPRRGPAALGQGEVSCQ